MSWLKGIFGAFLLFLIFTGVAVFSYFFGWFLYNWIAPKYVHTDYKVFQQSQSYQQGMIKDLQNMRMRYLNPKTTKEEKEAIQATVMQRFGGFDYQTLPPDLQQFYLTMRGLR